MIVQDFELLTSNVPETYDIKFIVDGKELSIDKVNISDSRNEIVFTLE